MPLDQYVARLAGGDLPDEWSVLLPEVTVNESYCFRSPKQLEALTTRVLPEMVRRRAGRRRLRVWSAGCARGEEPATLAILFAESPLLVGWQWEIVATDVDRAALADARRGRYGSRAVSKVPGDLRDRYFSTIGEQYELSVAVRRRIRYRLENLVELSASDAPYDLVFLRNVLIYFRPEIQVRVMETVARSLAPDGFLFLGPSETLWQVTDRFDSVDLETCFAYALRASQKRETRRKAARDTVSSGRPTPREKDANGVEQATSRPLARVTRPMSDAAEARGARSEDSTSGLRSLEGCVSALLENRFGDARDQVAEVVSAEPENVSARVVAGLIDEVCDRPADARAAYRAALYLAPEMYQARVLLADLLRRSGDLRRAVHEYRQVIRLLEEGSARELEGIGELPLPDRRQALQRSRAALERHGGAVTSG